MNRRDFLKDLGLALAAGWTITRLPWPRLAEAGAPNLRLALLADAHLKNGDPARPEAQALARAVAEIRTNKPAPNLVLFAGDLAHAGDARALALGQEILSDLPAPLFMVRGEGDGLSQGRDPWSRLFGKPRFAHTLQGAHILGLNTAWRPTAHGPAFALGETEWRWLTDVLARLDPTLPLIILSHAPLTPIFQPWQQWTANADRLAPLLARFRQATCLHGHVHHSGVRGQGSGVRNFARLTADVFLHTENRKPKTENLPLPATAWPLPSPVQGTPRRLQPGLAPHGCGWGIIALQEATWEFRPRIWRA